MNKETIIAKLGRVELGSANSVRAMGIINVCPDSSYKESARNMPASIAELAIKIEEDVADIIDIGGISTAPSKIAKAAFIDEESRKLVMAIQAIMDVVPSIRISVNTPRSKSADSALNAGTKIVNDVSGLKFDPKVKQVVSKHNAAVILMAHENHELLGSAINRIKRALAESLEIVKSAGIPSQSIVLDPGLGFFAKPAALVRLGQHRNQRTELPSKARVAVMCHDF